MTEHKRASITMAAFKSSKYAGVFSLCFIMFVMYVMTNILRLSFTNQLMLDHSNGRWYQFLTALFCHRDYMHLSGNLFFLYIFGRLIEEEEGMTGFLISFMVCGIGSNFCDYFLSPHGDYLSLGSSGAVFGLFTIALLIKFKMQLTSFLELLILIPFVFSYLKTEITRIGSPDSVAHDAHIYGALTGVLLVTGLKLINKKLSKPY